MKIAAYLTVKDEIDLIERAITHLRSIGVDLIVVIDYHSTDGTQDILRKFEADEDVQLVFRNELRAPSVEEESAHVLKIIAESKADWIIFLDADEFWIPASGNLKSHLSNARADVYSIPRYNVVLTTNRPTLPDPLVPVHYGDLQLFVDAIPHFYKYILDNPDTPWSRGVPGPKFMARTAVVGGVTAGKHDVIAKDGVAVQRATSEQILIAHVPFTTESRFTRKLENIRNECPGGPPDWTPGTNQTGWHWWRWISLADEGKLREEFQRQIINDAALDTYRAQLAVQSAADMFRNRINDNL
jgi:hypothetical protein